MKVLGTLLIIIAELIILYQVCGALDIMWAFWILVVGFAIIVTSQIDEIINQ